MTDPIHDTPILGMNTRPRVSSPIEYGDPESNNFWVEYPSGLVDLSRSAHLKDLNGAQESSLVAPGQLDVPVDGDRTIRIDTNKSAVVVIDMQNFFLHPDLRAHPKGLACVDPLMEVVPYFRSKDSKILWVNWGLTPTELKTIPPSLVRGFMKHKDRAQSPRGGFGSVLPGDFGKLLMRGEKNSDLYGPLQELYERGREKGTDFWIHKNRMSGIWEQTHLDNFLKENGITTLFFAGVNADQCVLGTFIDAYYRGYDCIMLKDATATTSPEGGFENVIYNAGNSYGFVTSTELVLQSK